MLTAKQKAWDKHKDEVRLERTQTRGVRTTHPNVHRVRGRHCPSCPHRWKGHKKTGRCKNGCECTLGAQR